MPGSTGVTSQCVACHTETQDPKLKRCIRSWNAGHGKPNLHNHFNDSMTSDWLLNIDNNNDINNNNKNNKMQKKTYWYFKEGVAFKNLFLLVVLALVSCGG